MKKDVQEISGIATDAARTKLGQWRDSVSDYYRQGRGTLHSAMRGSRQLVRERPFRSILIAGAVGVIAAGVGVLVGRIWMRR